jgi:SAM-dependent methyltransferase
MNIREFVIKLKRVAFGPRYSAPKPDWPYRLPEDIGSQRIASLREEADRIESASQYGWGHSIDFGPFVKQGFLDDGYLKIAGLLDAWRWWPRDLAGMNVADVGCFTGGLTLLMAARNPDRVFAVDEVPEHLQQCDFLCRSFAVENVETLESSLFDLHRKLARESFDLILLSGVLYHLSDMLVGLLVMRELLRPGGVLIIETNAMNDKTRSFANFGRFCGGMWWQPSALCVQDLCKFTGFKPSEARFYMDDRCLLRAERGEDDIPFKRGLNWRFEDLKDARRRSMDRRTMAPVYQRLFR